MPRDLFQTVKWEQKWLWNSLVQALRAITWFHTILLALCNKTHGVPGKRLPSIRIWNVHMNLRHTKLMMDIQHEFKTIPLMLYSDFSVICYCSIIQLNMADIVWVYFYYVWKSFYFFLIWGIMLFFNLKIFCH